MINTKREAITKALILLDSLVISLSFLFSLLLRHSLRELSVVELVSGAPFAGPSTFSINNYLPLLIAAVPLWAILLYANGMYVNLRTIRIPEIAWIILKSTFFVGVGLGTFIFLFQYKYISRLFFLIFLGVSFVAMLLDKVAFILFLRHVRKRNINFDRLLIVGTGKRAASLIRRIEGHPEWGLRIMGVLDDEPGRGSEAVGRSAIIGGLDQIASIVEDKAIDEVVFVVPRTRLNAIEKAVRVCETVGVKARVAMDLYDLRCARAKHVDLDGMPFVSFETTVASESQLMIKRAMDLMLASLGLIVVSPFLLIVSILVKLSTKGPVFFKQERVGLHGRRFTLLKFRTMYTGSEKRRTALESMNEMDGPVFKIRRDPRITSFGKILRKFSIDELPQLINVLLGHMSLIGPRALATYEAEKIDLNQRRRHSMRPGITCLWQISGRNRIGFNDWMELDLFYLDHWSLGLDMKILIRTIPNVLFGIGAY